MNTNRNVVGWFEIYVQDIDRAKTFYQNTFQVTLERLESPGIELWAFPMQPDNPGCAGALVKMDGKDSGVGGTIVYFSCADCAVEASRAVQNGGQHPEREDVHWPIRLYCSCPRYRGKHDRTSLDAIRRTKTNQRQGCHSLTTKDRPIGLTVRCALTLCFRQPLRHARPVPVSRSVVFWPKEQKAYVISAEAKELPTQPLERESFTFIDQTGTPDLH